MGLVLGFVELLGGILLLASAIANASFADVIRGKAGQDYSNQGSTLASTLAGAGSSTSATASSPAGAPQAVRTMLTQAQALVGRPYQFGGGHSLSNWLNAAAYDCSGFVSAVLGKAGVISSPQTTQTLPSQPNITTGPGQWVTIYDRNTNADTAEDHVIIDIAGHWFESGGGSGLNASGGVSAIAAPPASYLSTFNLILHPIGL